MKVTSSRLLALPVALLLAQAPATLSAPADDVEATLQHAVTHARIREALLEKIGADALRIDIDLTGSRVELSGEVEKKASQELAKEVALSVKGVTDVDDKLTVSPAGERSTGKHVEGEIKDAVLESKVKGRLLAEIGKNALKIEVEATDGVVSLRGEVPNSDVKRLALAKAKSTKGVRKVVSLLKSA